MTKEQKIIRAKVGLLELAKQLGNVSQASRSWGTAGTASTAFRSCTTLSQDTARLMVFKLVMAAAKTWRRLKGETQLPKVVRGVTFTNGVEVINTPTQTA